MVVKALELFKNVFMQCLSWTEALLASVGGTGIVLSAIAVILLTGVFILPIRGGQSGLGMDSAFSDFRKNVTYVTRKGKHYNGRRVDPRPDYRGKFESRKNGGHRSSVGTSK